MKYLLFISILMTSTASAISQSKSDYSRIISKFELWKMGQIKKGNYESAQRCNPDTVLSPGYKGPDAGFPNDVNIFFAYINGDDKIVALITFQPNQCDGGNALMNAQ